MLSIILHDTCLHLSNMCDIDSNSCIPLFNLYMQCHHIAFNINIKYYNSVRVINSSIVHNNNCNLVGLDIRPQTINRSL